MRTLEAAGVALLVAALGGASGGCVVDSAARKEIADLRRQVDGYRRQAEAVHDKSDELENRVFVLEDKVDTRAVSEDRAEGKAPRLPVVKKAAPPHAVAPADDAPPQHVGAGTVADRYTDENGDDVVVIYEGEAAKKPGKHATIKLGGGDDMQPVDEPAARAAPRPRRGKLPVVAAGGERLPTTDGRVPPIPASPASPAGPDADDPIGLYKSAYQALMRREHAAAIAGFTDFLARWPEHDHADNAQYWLGEAYYDQRDYTGALAQFRKVVKRYPDGNKAPDALLKIGYCYAKLGDTAAARDVLSQVVEIYPKTEAAKLAAKRLDEMRPEGAGATP